MQSIQPNMRASFRKSTSCMGSASANDSRRGPVLWQERQESIFAIQEGLADVDAGRTFPAEDVIRELREELHDG